MIRVGHLALLAALVASACSHGTPTQPRVPAALLFVTQPTTVNAGAPVNLQIRAADSSGATVTAFAGLITIAIGANPDTATLLGVTTAAAQAGVASFSVVIDQMGSGYTLTATTPGLPVATSSSFNILDGPSSMTTIAGDQPGLTGYPTNFRPAVQLTDVHGNPVPGIPVTFTTKGGGSLAGGGSVSTDANGVAQSGIWTLGPPGTDTVVASASGGNFPGNPTNIVAVSYAQAYPITLQPYGPTMPAAAQTAFNNAVTKWQTVIYRPLPAQNLSGVTAGACAAGTPALSGSTTGVVIYAAVETIDGAGKILAEAGPCVGRSDGLTAVGYMLFDSADIGGLISAGALNSVIEHEMGHVLGFGTEWGSCLSLPSNPPGTINDTYFSCPKAQAQFDTIGGGTYTGGNIVPVENCGEAPFVSPSCGTGTVNGHWRQVAFVNELMVGFLPSNPQLSSVTIASLEDIGYTVNYAGADNYTHTFTVSPVTAGPRVQLMNDIWQGPRYVATADGVIHLVRPGIR